MAIPWASLNITPSIGKEIPCDILFVDHASKPFSRWDEKGVNFTKISLDLDGNPDTTNYTLILGDGAEKN